MSATPGPEPLDVRRARRETTGCHERVHFNNAGAALPPDVVVETVVDHLRDEARYGGYEAAAAAEARLDAIYPAIAALLGARREEIALLESATRAWDLALSSLDLGAGEVVLTGESEYSSNVLALLQQGQRRGVRIEIVGSDGDGVIDLEALERRLDAVGPRASLVALTHVATSTGAVQPAAAVGALSRARGIPYLLDACQSVGQVQLDVDEIGCDLLSATGRKFLRAPRGTGFLYVREALLERLVPPFVDLHSATWAAEDRYEVRADARRFETWEANVAARLGLGAAVDYALGWGISPIERRVIELAELLRERLTESGLPVHDRGRLRCGIVTLSVPGQPAEHVVRALHDHRVNTSVARAGSARLDLGRRGLDDVVRASVHYYNTEAEIDRLILVLDSLRRQETGFQASRSGHAGAMSDTHDNAAETRRPEAGTGTAPSASAAGPNAGTEATDQQVPTGGNAAQAAAVFGPHSEAPVEMDSGGAG